MSDNPVLVNVMRGDVVECTHRGAISIVDADGKTMLSLGDVDRPIYPRSAIKPLQALYFVESGAADQYEAGSEGIALACASHNGEAAHVDGVVQLLSRAGLTETCLECGAQWPKLPDDRERLMKADERPTAIHNNCSGKHTSFILAAQHLGEKTEGYVKPNHPVQKALKAILEETAGVNLSDPAIAASDGCSIPTYAMPLRATALAMARLGAASNMGASRDRAARRIYAACHENPHLVAGETRFDTEVMRLLKDQVVIKTGAEGVYAAMFPKKGLGVAIKCDDGATRASEVMMAGVLQALMPDEQDNLAPFLNVPIKNRNQWLVGEIRLADDVQKVLTDAIT